MLTLLFRRQDDEISDSVGGRRRGREKVKIRGSVTEMNIVCFGGGTNSTAMITGMYLRGIPIDLITFADTGCEQPHTYEFISILNKWLKEHNFPQITTVFYTDKNGKRLTLEEECL